ncbi:hypothetical protein GCM10023225_01790 [Kineococcus glutinatus]|uniref:Pyridoxamine 5'-phosphate oxidase N-terminal domain-containing protein n=2 Tax=Kineococcus glutinatus TaxID=1070872 RepID=A0ABP9H5L4_9ACTN
MRRFVARMDMVFVATADRHGEADCSFRAGPAGFVTVLGPRSLVYPEYRGNGVMASLGNVVENGHVGLLFVDFFEATIGLHVNGRAAVCRADQVRDLEGAPPALLAAPGSAPGPGRGRAPELFVLVQVDEAYIHCGKHVPLLRRAGKDRDWGTDDPVRKGGDYFRAKREDRPWAPLVEPRTGAGA